MDTQKQNLHTCKGCRYYNVFYIKSAYSFNKHKAGFCTQQQKAVSESNKCGLYKYRPQEEKNVTVENLDIAIEDLKELVRTFYNCNF